MRVTRTKPNTVWRQGQFTVDDDETIIELDQGTIFLFDDSEGPSPKPLKIVTPAGTASPKGTWMSMSYDPVLKVAELQCFRGSCLLEHDLGSELLFDEQKTTITRQSPPRKAIVMSKTETRLFVQLPEAVSGEVVIPAPEPVRPPTPQPTDTPPAPATSPAGEPAARLPATRVAGTSTSATSVASPIVPNLGPTPLPTPKPVVVPVAKLPEPTSGSTSGQVSVAVPAPAPVPAPASGASNPTPTPVPEVAPTPELASVPPSLGVPFPAIDESVLPHVFVGSAKLNGLPAPDGTVVTAWVEGFSEPLAQSVINSSEFLILVNQYGVGSLEGETIVFRLDGWEADGSGICTSGGADFLDLDAGSG